MLKVLLIVVLGGIGLVALGVIAFSFLLTSADKNPLQDRPIGEREWGNTVLLVAQDHYFEIGKPGRATFSLMARAEEYVARCEDVKDDRPSFTAKTGSAIEIELHPVLTGGKCGHQTVGGSHLPEDPRQFKVELPDLILGPVTVTLRQAGKAEMIRIEVTASEIHISHVADSSAAGAGFVRLEHTRIQRLPTTFYLVYGSSSSNGIYGGNLPPEGAPGDLPETKEKVRNVYQYCHGPKPFTQSNGSTTFEGKDVFYSSGVSLNQPAPPLDQVYEEISSHLKSHGMNIPELKVREMHLDGRTSVLPK